jgi:hypothetical protein
MVTENKNSPPRRRAVLVDLCLSISALLLIHHPNKKNPTFPEEVGFGRRVRGNVNNLYILGGILPEK